MSRLRVVLVEPREAGNVGAAARVMKNFGFDELWIVGEHPQLLPVSGWWASGADDVLEQARFAETLQEAVADTHRVIATSSLRGRTTPADLTPRQLVPEFAALGNGQTMALVFGREDSGLTREEVGLCHRTAVVPTNGDFPTMNLAQAVGVFCYELSSIDVAAQPRELANAALVERLHERVESLLLEAGFLHDNNPDRIYDDIRAIAGRAALDEREATILLGAVRQVEWKIRR
jgi:tRNA/rRNA methyltransferase